MESSSVPSNSNKNGLYSCPVCDQSFIDGLLLETHFQAEHDTATSNEMVEINSITLEKSDSQVHIITKMHT